MNDQQRDALVRSLKPKSAWVDPSVVYEPGTGGMDDFEPVDHAVERAHLMSRTSQTPQVELVPNGVLYLIAVSSVLSAIMSTVAVAVAIFALATRD